MVERAQREQSESRDHSDEKRSEWFPGISPAPPQIPETVMEIDLGFRTRSGLYFLVHFQSRFPIHSFQNDFFWEREGTNHACVPIKKIAQIWVTAAPERKVDISSPRGGYKSRKSTHTEIPICTNSADMSWE